MAYKLIWSPASRDDLLDIVAFISRDSRQRAETFGYRLIAETETLQTFSEIGRVVPEYRDPTIREIIVRILSDCYRSITSGSSSRLHEFGMQREGRPNCETRGQ